MKNYLLSVVALCCVGACNSPATSASEEKPLNTPVVVTQDSQPSSPAKPQYAVGLTLEEMRDDSVFADGSIPTSWEVAGITDVNAFKVFLKQIQRMVLANEKEALAQYVKYPLNKNINTEADFIKRYDELFTKDTKLSIANLNLSQLFRNSKGVMTEEGRIWFGKDGDNYKIIAVNN